RRAVSGPRANEKRSRVASEKKTSAFTRERERHSTRRSFLKRTHVEPTRPGGFMRRSIVPGPDVIGPCRAEVPVRCGVSRGRALCERHRGTGASEIREACRELGAAGGMELDERLAEQRDRRLLEEESRQREPPPHPGRVGADRPVVLRREAHPFQSAGSRGDGQTEQPRK